MARERLVSYLTLGGNELRRKKQILISLTKLKVNHHCECTNPHSLTSKAFQGRNSGRAAATVEAARRRYIPPLPPLPPSPTDGFAKLPTRFFSGNPSEQLALDAVS